MGSQHFQGSGWKLCCLCLCCLYLWMVPWCVECVTMRCFARSLRAARCGLAASAAIASSSTVAKPTWSQSSCCSCRGWPVLQWLCGTHQNARKILCEHLGFDTHDGMVHGSGLFCLNVRRCLQWKICCSVIFVLLWRRARPDEDRGRKWRHVNMVSQMLKVFAYRPGHKLTNMSGPESNDDKEHGGVPPLDAIRSTIGQRPGTKSQHALPNPGGAAPRYSDEHHEFPQKMIENM